MHCIRLHWVAVQLGKISIMSWADDEEADWFHLERLLLLAFWVQKRCKIALSFHCCIYSEYTSHPPIFVHALEAEKLQIGPKVDCDWSILGSRFSLVESSAFPGCLANVAACLNSCFMPTPIFTLISAKHQIHIIIHHHVNFILQLYHYHDPHKGSD